MRGKDGRTVMRATPGLTEFRFFEGDACTRAQASSERGCSSDLSRCDDRLQSG